MNVQRRALALGGLGAAALAGCGGGTSVGTPGGNSGRKDSANTLQLAISAEPSTLDPTLTAASIEARIVDELFEALVIYGPQLDLRPGAAERWDTSDDGLVTTFHLRDKLRWSNGEPVRAAEFVYALQRQVTPATAATGTEPLRWIQGAMDLLRGKSKDLSQLGVTAPDDRTVVITLLRRDATLLNAATRFFPLRRVDIEAAPRQWTRPGRGVSNGPFMMQTWVPNGRIELVKNPHFHAASSVALDGIRITVLPDRGTGFKMFQTGALDVTRVPDERLPYVRRTFPQLLQRQPLNGTLFIGLKETGAPFENQLPLRRALALAIDQVTLMDKVQRTGSLPAFSFITPGLAGYTPATADFKDWPMARRIEEARRLYAQAGYGPNKPLALTISYATDARLAVLLQAVADMWRSALGVQTTLDNSEQRVFIENMTRKKLTVFAAGWNTSRTDAFMLSYFANPADNEIDYANPRYTALVAQATSAATPAERAALFAQAERLLMDDQPIIPLAHGVSHVLVSPRLRGWQPNLADAHPARFISIV